MAVALRHADTDSASVLGMATITDGPAELIAHILERYHRIHLREFPVAIRLARAVEIDHARAPDCPAGLADHLALMADELAGHQRKEETLLFPLLLRGDGARAEPAIRRMMSEHDDVDDQLTRLAALTRDFIAPPGACERWRALYRACHKIDRDLRDHMRLEDQVLFPMFLSRNVPGSSPSEPQHLDL
ncbi:MAG: hemerythrin domain-containing protein [Caulobacter sp.]|jgi:regulator of cell morphogenesis and NO signaling|nr:hemerythrin domain-containing protein [Caulobacter sp.]